MAHTKGKDKDYPATRYAADYRVPKVGELADPETICVVANEEADKALGKGWYDSPKKAAASVAGKASAKADAKADEKASHIHVHPEKS